MFVHRGRDKEVVIMTIASFERELWRELQVVTGNKKIRLKDLLEWRSAPFEGMKGEKIVFLEKFRIWVAIPEVM